MSSDGARRGDPARQALDDAIVAWMCEEEWRDDEVHFNDLALELFAHQFEHCEPYQRFCLRRSATPENVEQWRDIPPVPTGVFKEMALRSFAKERTVQTFRTSGTSTTRRGELHLDTLRLYDASLISSFGHFMLPELETGQRAPCLRFLAPNPTEAPDSSLSYMFGRLADGLAGPDSGFRITAGRAGGSGAGWVGLRPEHLKVDVGRGEGVSIGKGIVSEHASDGVLTTLAIQWGGHVLRTHLVAGRGMAREVATGDDVSLAVRPEDVHVFGESAGGD